MLWPIICTTGGGMPDTTPASVSRDDWRRLLDLVEGQGAEIRRLLEGEAERRGRATADDEIRKRVVQIAAQVQRIELSLARREGGRQVEGAGGAWIAGLVGSVISGVVVGTVVYLLVGGH